MGDGDMLRAKELPLEKLRRTLSAEEVAFETTAELEPLTGTIGQERALEAIRTGLGTRASGFNIFATGEVGTGRSSAVRALTMERAAGEPVPGDWCYVNNFENPDEPIAIQLPAGLGCRLAQDMEKLIGECKTQIPKAFAGEQYEKQRNEVAQSLQRRRQELLSDLSDEARELDHAIQLTPAGIVLAPLADGEPMSQEDFEQLEESKQEELRAKGEKVRERAAETMREARQMEKEAKARAEELTRKIGLFTVGHLIEELEEKYGEHPRVVEYLNQVRKDIISNIDMFRSDEEEGPQLFGLQLPRKQRFERYVVNVVVDNCNAEGAPVIEERNPTYYHLFGRLEYRAQIGAMVTDFTMIKAGAFQKASGGYLVLQALDLLRNPFAWEGLKRAIRTGQVKIENMWEQFANAPAATVRPEPIPADVKVVLIGSPLLYHLLYFFDEDFRRLFKIRADFDVEMDFSGDHLEQYSAFVAARCADAELPAFDREATLRVAEYGLRLAAHQDRLSTEFLRVADLITEAGDRAKARDGDRVTAGDVAAAIEARERRSRMLQDKLQRAIKEDVLIIDTEGATVGQVNGLAVYDLGDYRFGRPSRITAVTAVGGHGVVNIERESKLSGRIHDKGVLILSGYLADRFGHDKPLSLSASLCFEQSYSGVEGDSASCAELFALISSLAEVPVRQDLAVTGSVNQRGQVQPIGGANEKIEGFFEVCRERGLTGDQGVVIPARNVKDLMLSGEVLAAAEEGKFHVYAIETVEEGIEILTGVAAGERNEEGLYPDDTVYGRADRRLRNMGEVLKEFGHPLPERAREKTESAEPQEQ